MGLIPSGVKRRSLRLPSLKHCSFPELAHLRTVLVWSPSKTATSPTVMGIPMAR